MRAVVVVPILRSPRTRRRPQPATPQQRSAEARRTRRLALAAAIDLDLIHLAVVTVNDPRPATLLGSGKVEELAAIVKDTQAGLVDRRSPA